jgi:hypothetical protein
MKYNTCKRTAEINAKIAELTAEKERITAEKERITTSKGQDGEEIHVKCSKHKICVLSCTSPCNTLTPTDPKDGAAAERWRLKYGQNDQGDSQSPAKNL